MVKSKDCVYYLI